VLPALRLAPLCAKAVGETPALALLIGARYPRRP